MAQVFLSQPVMSLLAVLVVPGLILYFMTPEERLRLVRQIEGLLVRARVVVATSRSGTGDPFYAALRARRRWPVVTWTLVAANVGVLIAMLAARIRSGPPTRCWRGAPTLARGPLASSDGAC